MNLQGTAALRLGLALGELLVWFCSAGILPASSNRRKPGDCSGEIPGLYELAGGVAALLILAKNGDAISIAIPSAGESHLQDELSPVNKVHRERRISHVAVYVL
jgi:hypothetical protein